MAQLVPISPSVQTKQRPIPPLENGDHLTRDEFERRFDATPGLKKAELIDGVVYMSPPVSHFGHSVPHFDFIGVLALYRAYTPGIIGGDNGSLRLDMENMPQPDIYLIIDAARGGQAKIDADGYVIGGPEFIVEIAATSASYDLHQKLQLYRRNAVREYVVWRTFDHAFDFFRLENVEYKKPSLAADGIFRSEVFPGLWIDSAALMRSDLSAAIATLQQGIASPEHAAFVAKLKAIPNP